MLNSITKLDKKVVKMTEISLKSIKICNEKMSRNFSKKVTNIAKISLQKLAIFLEKLLGMHKNFIQFFQNDLY